MNLVVSLLIIAAVVVVAAVKLKAANAARQRAEEEKLKAEQECERQQAQVRDSLAARQALLEASLDCVMTLDAGGKITSFGGSAEMTFGCPAAAMVGKPLSEYVLPTVFGKVDADALLRFFTDDNGKMLGRPVEMTGVRTNGQEFPAELCLTRVRAGAVPSYTGFLREITERIKGETAMFERASLAAMNVEINQALAGTGSLRATLQRCADVLIWHLDVAQARFWVMDESGESLELEVNAGTDSELEQPGAKLALENSYLGRLAREGRPYLTNKINPVLFDPAMQEWIGRMGMVSFAAHPMQIGNRVVGILTFFDRKPLAEGLLTNLAAMADGIMLYIERYHTEEHVREQAALLDEATDAIHVRDLAGRITFWSRGAEKIFGWTSAEAVGREANDLLVETGTTTVAEAQAVTLSLGKWSGEFVLRAKDGREVIIESRWTLVRREDDAPKAFLVIATDITEKKQLEKKFLRTQRLEVIGTLAGGVAHDLNNMLGPIMIVSQLLRNKLTDEKSVGWLSMMQSNAQRGAAMVKQILTFARGMGGGQGSLQLHHLIGDVERMARETFPSTITIEVHAPRTLWAIQGDATQLHQVLLNLCVNARDAMPNGGRLKIAARNIGFTAQDTSPTPELAPGKYVELSVTDSGTGIPPEVKSKVFEPFFTTKEPGKGTGLGLSTVKNIVDEHKGLITLESEVGRGTAFRLYFPAGEAHDTKTAEVWPAELLAGGGEQILLVDDELAIRELVKATLEDFGYKVVTGADGAEAVALFAQQRARIDAVIVDITMPVMDGPSAIHVLRKINPEVKIIVISGVASGDQVSEFERMPHTAFLPKPFNVDQLLRMLRKLLDHN